MTISGGMVINPARTHGSQSATFPMSGRIYQKPPQSSPLTRNALQDLIRDFDEEKQTQMFMMQDVSALQIDSLLQFRVWQSIQSTRLAACADLDLVLASKRRPC